MKGEGRIMNEPFHKDMLDRSRRDRPLYLQVYEILQTHIRDMRNSGNADSRKKKQTPNIRPRVHADNVSCRTCHFRYERGG